MSPLSASRRSSERILEMAAPRGGVVSRIDLLAAGFTRGFVRGRVEAGWLLPLVRGVYAVGHPVESEGTILAAALVAAGPDSALAGASAAAVWEIRRWKGPVEIVRPKGRTPTGFRLERPGLRRPRAVRVRRTRRVDPGDFSNRHGLRLTGIERTLLDLAGVLNDRGLRSAFNEADRLGLLRRDRLLDCVDRGQSRPGGASFRRLVETRHPETVSTESELETSFMDLCRRHSIPVPDSNPVLCGYRVDCLWSEYRLVVELDGFEFHRGRMAFEKDAVRDAELSLAGFRVLRLTYDMVMNRSEQTALLIRSHLERRVDRERAG